MANLFSVFLQHYHSSPEKIFFHSKYGDISYKLADRIIKSFTESICGDDPVQPHTVIAVSYTNPDILFFIIWACIKSNISLVLLPPLKDPAYIKEILNQTGASYMISNVAALDSISKNIELESIIMKSFNNTDQNVSHPQNIRGIEAAFIFHTSGTTGTPKLVKIEYAKFSASIDYLFENDFMPYTVNQTAYIVPPLFHSYGLSSMLEYTRGGSAIKLPTGINFLDSVKELTRKNPDTEITAIEGVPFFYHYLSLLLSKLELNKLNHIGFGGDAVPEDVIKKYQDKYFGISFSIRYGLTETPSVVSLNVIQPPYSDVEVGGKILSIYEVRTLSSHISNEDFRILIKGPCMGSYIDNRSDHSEWFETGDNGYMKNDRLYITGRESTFIKNRGFRISPHLIESIIRNYNGIKDCIVYSHNDELFAKIIVEDSENFIKQNLFQVLNEKLPEYYVPKNIFLCDEIPRTISGKLIREVSL